MSCIRVLLIFLITSTSSQAESFFTRWFKKAQPSTDPQHISLAADAGSTPQNLKELSEAKQTKAYEVIKKFKKTHNNHGGYLYQSKHIYNKILSSSNGLTDQEFEKELSHLGQEQKKHGVLPETHLKVASSLREYHETHKLARQSYKP